MKTSEKAKAIKKRFDGQVSPGIYIKTIGRKYVTLLNTWGTTTIEKVDIDEFYDNYVSGR
jgi:hypothetical protein